jgi:hypothetical protein
MTAPVLAGDALAAVRHRGSHLQIIASAGSGKTEVVAQRFAALMADGADPAGIIAFTFTERAAQELKARISARVEQGIGPQALDRLGAAFVGTIHAYCFRLLQHHVPRYETFDVLDERRLTAFLCREEPALGPAPRHGRAIRPRRSISGTVDRMTLQPAGRPDLAESYEVIHLGGEAAAIVPLTELRRLRAVERRASREALEEAEIESTLAAHDEWVAAGCPGARSHEDVMAELLGSDQ